MNAIEFDDAFSELTGNPPFPWQRALYQDWFRVGKFPGSCNIPTGLGKTSVIAIWLIAWANFPKATPRRLVYVVNRRTVVDQTTDEVEKIRKNLDAETPVAKLLRERIGRLAISTLRGQFADNREWSADPSRPAVICGTVDMIGSRLLFSGYGCGFKSKPLQAGFLGQDVLLVHDEAHLEPAFQRLLVAIEVEQRRCKELGKFHVVELSATSRGDGEDFKLTKADEENEEVKKRIHSAKAIALHPIADEKKELTDRILELSLAHRDSKRPILVFVRSVEAVGAIVTAIHKQKLDVQQLTGTLRGLERDELVNNAIFKRFLPKASPEDKTAYLVCTSAGEVGVNISADHLVCDLSTYEGMAQRFGRVNRFGEHSDTRIDIVHPNDFENNPLEASRSRTLALLQLLNGKGSPVALGNLNANARAQAFAPTPMILPVSNILFDTWALTTIRDKLPGRPPVAPYLHGISEWEPPQTQVAWREDVWVLGQGPENDRERKQFERFAAELLDDYPLKPLEVLKERSDRVYNSLKILAAEPITPAWILDDDGAVHVTTIGQIIKGDKKDLDDRTLLLPPQAGGLEKGFLTPNSKYDSTRADYDVADEWMDKSGFFRIRKWDDDAKPEGMKCIRVIPVSDPGDPDAEPSKIWYWFVRSSASDSPTVGGRREYGLQPHLDDAKAAATKFLANLTLDANLVSAVILAAQFHDLGKDRKRWQNGIGNSEYPEKKLAKSGDRRAAIERSAYRHELGSVLDVTEQPAFQSLAPDLKELALHLIAAHHGRARPHFSEDEAFDHEPRGRDVAGLVAAIPGRFARLQLRYGRWGLAYLESLVRASDILASQKAEGSAA